MLFRTPRNGGPGQGGNSGGGSSEAAEMQNVPHRAQQASISSASCLQRSPERKKSWLGHLQVNALGWDIFPLAQLDSASSLTSLYDFMF